MFYLNNKRESDDCNTITDPVLQTLASNLKGDMPKNEIYVGDFDDADSGLGDSTPPSPTWTYDEDCEESSIGIERSTPCFKKTFGTFSYLEEEYINKQNGKYWK